MNIDIESLSTTRSVLAISLTSEEVAEVRNAAVKDIVSKASIPGFRKGKAPRSVVEQKFGSRIEETLRDNLLRKSFEQVTEEKKDELRIFEIVSQDEYNIADDGTAAIKFTVDLFPKFDIPEASALKIEPVKTELTDEMVEQQLKGFHNTLATFKDATSDSVVQDEDMVQVSYAGTVDGKPLETVYEGVDSYAKSDEAWCSVGYEYFSVPGLPKALVGKKEGDTGTLEVEFPADFVKEALRGVKATYTFTVKKIRVRELPELTPEVLKPYNLESVDALRDRIRENMKRQFEYEDRQKNLEAVADALCEATVFDLPEAALERETNQNLERLLTYNMNKGVSKENLSEERDALTEQARKDASRKLKLNIIAEQICRTKKIVLDQEEFSSFITDLMFAQHISPDLMKNISKNEGMMRNLYQTALQQKVLAGYLTDLTKNA